MLASVSNIYSSQFHVFSLLSSRETRLHLISAAGHAEGKMALSGARIIAESPVQDGNVYYDGWWVSGATTCDWVHMSPDQGATLIKKILKRRKHAMREEIDVSGKLGECRSIRFWVQNREALYRVSLIQTTALDTNTHFILKKDTIRDRKYGLRQKT